MSNSSQMFLPTKEQHNELMAVTASTAAATILSIAVTVMLSIAVAATLSLFFS